MVFITINFLIFFTIVFVFAIFFKGKKFYPVYLTFVSFVFYSFFSINFTKILFLLIIANYSLNTLLVKFRSKLKIKKIIFASIIIVNISTLSVFKYYNFFIENLFVLEEKVNFNLNFTPLEIILPIGISFYIFKLISYTFDLYRKEIQQESFMIFASYISFFPQLLSGPIMRYKPFSDNLKKPFDYNSINVALKVASGLLKKLVISSFLFKFIQDPFTMPQNYSSLDLVLAILALGAYIYTDFSGYSDLSNACANLLGFDTTQNFNSPYKSKSLSEFWKRWHISLSSWLKDYLYIPLGGNRKGKIRTYINLFLTMILGGFWHGASIVFIFWGAMHGIGLVFDKLMHSLLVKINFPIFNKLLVPFKWLLTFLIVHIAWVFFFSLDIKTAFEVFENILKLQVNNNLFIYWQLFMVLIIVYFMNFKADKFSKILQQFLQKRNVILQTFIFILIFYIILKLGPSEVPPFVYFKF